MTNRVCPSKPRAFLATFFALAALLIAAAPAAAQATLQLLDVAYQPVTAFKEFEPITVYVLDPGLAGAGSVQVRVASQLRGDEEWVTLTEDSGQPGAFSAVLLTAATLGPAPPALSDGTLEAQAATGPPLLCDTVEAELIGCSTGICPFVTVPLRGDLVTFLDRIGNATEAVVLGGPVRLRVEAPGANLDDLALDTLEVTVLSRSFAGAVRDSEPLTLTETGVATAIFAGQLPSRQASAAAADDGELTAMAGLDADRLEAGTSLAGATADPVTAILRFTDPAGADVTGMWGTGDFYLELESPTENLDPAVQEQLTNLVLVSSGDSAQATLSEQGENSGLFRGQLSISIGNPAIPVFIEGQLGDTVTAYRLVGSAEVTDEAELIPRPGNPPVPADTAPVAVNDTVTIPEDSFTALIPVVANDYDAEGQAFSILRFDTVTAHGSVTLTTQPPNNLSYWPHGDWNGTDTFTYTLTGGGSSATGTVTVTVTPVPDRPVAARDTVTTTEDAPLTFAPMANDSDPDGDAFSISSVQANGLNVVTNANGTLTFTPAANANGLFTFYYYLQDATGLGSFTGYVDVTVTPVADPPKAVNDSLTANEDLLTVLSVKTNDSDPDGGTLTVQSVTQPSHGTVTLSSGTVSYLSQLNYYGPDSFTYTLVDNTGLTATATVTLQVYPVNDPPVAAPDTATTPEDTLVRIDVLANDTDPDAGDILDLSLVSAAAHGTVTKALFNGRYHWRYTPQANSNGADSFSYRVVDGYGVTSNTVTVSVTVTPVNDTPDALNDTATTPEDTAVTINVLANDVDADGTPLTVTSATLGGTATGTVTINPDKTLTYVPGLDYYGGGGYILYTVSDGTATDTAMVTLGVTAVNDPPVAVADLVTTLEDQPVSRNLLANDLDPETPYYSLILDQAGGALHGTVTLIGGGTVTYTPQADWNGSDSFAYTVRDAGGLTATGTVAVTVTAVNDAPLAVADAATLDEDTSVTVAVTGNDTDRDGDSLTVTAVGSAAHGSVSFSGGSVTYSPAANYNGADAVTYTVSDGHGGTATAALSLTVTPVNDPPSANGDAQTVAEDGSTFVSVLANDSDPEGQVLTITAVGSAFNGSVSFGATSVSYTPAANYHGSDAFTYTVSDAAGATATATVTITVTPVGDPPVAAADSFVVDEDVATALALTANDSDPDGEPLFVSNLNSASHGTVSFGDGGIPTYTPFANYSGPDSFTYQLTDSAAATSTATVSLTVVGINDPPVVGADSYATGEDTPLTFAPLGNDSDADGDTLSIAAITAVTGGTASATATSITFDPAADFSGSAQVSFTVSDGQGGSAAGAATITVAAVNDGPVAVADAGSVAEDDSLTLPVLQNDSDVETPAGLVVTAVSPAAHGAVGFTATAVIYTPAANYHGPDAFTYSIADPQGATSSATVSLVVSPVNDPPVAANDSASTVSGTSVTIAVLPNDADLDGDPLVVTAVGAPLHGSAVRNADDTVTYTPAAGYSGADTFTYTATDGMATAAGTVAISVNNAVGQASVLAVRSVWIETGADVLSGDVVANTAGGAPYLGSTDLEIGSGVTVAASSDVKGNGVKILSGATIYGDVVKNTLTNSGTILGTISSPLALPVFATLPTLLTATSGATDVNLAQNQTVNLAPGVYRDLIVAKKGTVNFTGGVYVFRSVIIQREANLLFAAPSTVKVEQKMSTATMTKIQPGPGSTATAATIVWHIAGINGTNGALASTPKPLEIATDNVLNANFYVPNGTLWLQARTVATGSFIGRNVRIGPDVQVSLASAW